MTHTPMTNESNVTPIAKPDKPPAALPVTVDVNNPVSLYLDTAVFNQVNRVAVMMSKAGLAPKHLQGDDKIADCILVVAQALRWRSDPFAVAQHTFVTQGKLGYEGKLIAAMVNASGKLAENLNYTYSGAGDDRKVVVSGSLKGSTVVREIDGTVGKWKTNNEFWKKNPDQMLAYRGAREWARRHMPEVLLGVNSDDEIAPRTMVDVSPATGAAALNEALARVAPASEVDDLRTVDGEVIDGETGELLVEKTIGDGEIVDAEQAAADAARSRTDDLIAALDEMPTAADIDQYAAQIKADLDALPVAERGRFNTARLNKAKAVGAGKRK